MNKVNYVLSKLRPDGGYVIWNNDFNTIRWDEGVTPLTQKEFDNGLAQVDTWLAEEAEAKAQTKATAESKLAALGLTTDDLRVLGL